MNIYKQDNDYTIYQGDSFEVLDTLEEKSIDAIVTDPPYGLTSIAKRYGKKDSAPAKEGKDGSFARLSKGFMGKTWDGTGIEHNVDFWKKCFKVLKPGGYLLAFGGTRTFHRIACAIEDAGFEIRDTLMWLYGSGFPKSQNVGLAIDKKNGVESVDTGIESPNARPNCTKENTLYESGTVGKKFTIKQAQNEYAGYGTCLKPAYEPIIMARKPVEGTVADNMLKYGVGAINIDECRVEYEKTTNPATNPFYRQQNADKYKQVKGGELSNGVVRWTSGKNGVNDGGRFPANVITDGSDEVKANMPNTKANGGKTTMSDFSKYKGSMMNTFNLKENSSRKDSNYIAPKDEGSACRYFYCAKASKKDRDEGLEEFNEFYTLKEDTPQEIREKIKLVLGVKNVI